MYWILVVVKKDIFHSVFDAQVAINENVRPKRHHHDQNQGSDVDDDHDAENHGHEPI